MPPTPACRRAATAARRRRARTAPRAARNTRDAAADVPPVHARGDRPLRRARRHVSGRRSPRCCFGRASSRANISPAGAGATSVRRGCSSSRACCCSRRCASSSRSGSNFDVECRSILRPRPRATEERRRQERSQRDAESGNDKRQGVDERVRRSTTISTSTCAAMNDSRRSRSASSASTICPRARRWSRSLDGVLRYGPYAMFVLLPAFALLLKILYLGRGRRYPTRPRLYCGAPRVRRAQPRVPVPRGRRGSRGLGRRGCGPSVIVWMLVYMVWSLRVVYGGRWLGIALRAFVMFVAYSILFGFVTAGLLVVAGAAALTGSARARLPAVACWRSSGQAAPQ